MLIASGACEPFLSFELCAHVMLCARAAPLAHGSFFLCSFHGTDLLYHGDVLGTAP